MSNNQCSVFPSLDLAALERTVRALAELGVGAEEDLRPIPDATAEQMAKFRKIAWQDDLHQLLPLVTEIKTVHKQCHERQETSINMEALQAQLDEARQIIEQQKQQSVSAADVRQELRAVFDLAEQHMVSNHEATLTRKREELEQQYRAKEETLEAGFLGRDLERESELTALKERNLALDTEATARTMKVSDLESKLEASQAKVSELESTEHEREQTYQTKVSELERAFEQKQRDLEAELEAKLRQRQADMDVANARQVEQADAEKVRLTTQKNELSVLQTAIETSRTGLTEQQEKLTAESEALATRESKLKRAQATAARQVREVREMFEGSRATQKQNQQDLIKAHEDFVAEDMQTFELHRQELAESKTTLEGLVARSKAFNKEAQQHEANARRADERAKATRDETAATLRAHTERMDGKIADFGAEVRRQEAKERTLRDQQILLEEQAKSLNAKEATLDKTNATLNDALQQLEQPPSSEVVDGFVAAIEKVQHLEQALAATLSASPSGPVVDRLVGATEKLQQLEETISETLSSSTSNAVVDKLVAATENLQQLERTLSSSPSNAVVDKLVAATENLQQLERTLSSPPKGELVGDRLLAAIDKLDNLALSARRRRSPTPSDPFVDRESDLRRAPRRLTFDTPTASIDPKRFAEASPELSGGRAPLKKPRSALKITRPLRSPPNLSHERDPRTRLPSSELGSPRGTFRRQQRVVRDSVDPMSVSNWRNPGDVRHDTVTADEGANLGIEVEEEEERDEGGEEGLETLVRADSLAGVARRAYDKIQFPTDGSWTEDLNSWFTDLLRRHGFNETVMEWATFNPTDQISTCFRSSLVGRRKPIWKTLSPQTNRCDTCRNGKQPACVYFLHCDGVSAANPTDRQGKRWKLLLRTG